MPAVFNAFRAPDQLVGAASLGSCRPAAPDKELPEYRRNGPVERMPNPAHGMRPDPRLREIRRRCVTRRELTVDPATLPSELCHGVFAGGPR